ncbi:MAG: helix-turn-helix transcriptional regulator [Candidatus Gastranaerophilales bacterium]
MIEVYDPKTIGLIVKKHRKLNKFTQFMLAELIDLNEKQITKIELGMNYPSLPTFLKIINILKIDINEFFQEDAILEKPTLTKIKKNLNSFNDKDLSLYLDLMNTIKKYKN